MVHRNARELGRATAEAWRTDTAAMAGRLGKSLLATPGWWLALPLTIGAWALPHAARANDLCNIAGSTATCSGDQSAGVVFLNGSGVATINVNNLTTPIAPATAVPGILLTQTGADGGFGGGAGSAG